MWAIGQRVIAEFEPELGLGVVTAILGARQIEVAFPAVDMTRRYSQQSAPLRRLVVTPGQKIKSKKGKTLTVVEIREVDSLFQFETEEGERLLETELERLLEDESPAARLMNSTWEHPKSFDLRRRAWGIRSESLEPEIRGLVGPRVSLLPHQLGIASEVARREYPRVLLSDEVGLGKTIEAGLIFSSLRALGRADRVLIVVPEGLQHQWLAEMYRRFNEMFSVIDETRSEQEDLSQGQSAFAMNQRIICSLQFLEQNGDRLQQAIEEDWDLLIVDEAHRLKWDEEEPSIEWDMVRLLSERAQGILLLTATPQSQGVKTQFGLLSLVDPDRFLSFETFAEQSEAMKEVATLAEKIEANERPATLAKTFKKRFPDDEDLLKSVKSYLDGESGEELLQRLIDRHGTGRVLYRNRRARIKGFPARKLVPHPFNIPEAYEKWLATSAKEFSDEDMWNLGAGRPELRGSPAKNEFFEARAFAVLKILESLPDQKILLICSSPRVVRKLQEWLRTQSAIRTAIFDEDLEIVERDRQAAWFSEKDGARVLLCSEIGGEGRNFQFCQHLILFDLPAHPDMVEQRIGRLDRIGQKSTIQVHVPYIKDSAEEVLLRWHDEAIELFTRPWGGAVLPEVTKSQLAAIFRDFLPRGLKGDEREKEVKRFLKESKKIVAEVRKEQEAGVDLLVDLNSFCGGKGIDLQKRIHAVEESATFRKFLEDSFEYFGIDSEKLDGRGAVKIAMHSLTFVESFPGLSHSGELLATYDRMRALEQEDLTFLTREHPIGQGALSLILEGNVGKVTAGAVAGSSSFEKISFELLYVLETTAPAYLEIQRDLPTQVLQIVLDVKGKPVKLSPKTLAADLRPLPLSTQHAVLTALKSSLPNIFEKASKMAADAAKPIVTHAKEEWTRRSIFESTRLAEMAKINPLISEEELRAFEKRTQAGVQALDKTIPRLDAIRIIFE